MSVSQTSWSEVISEEQVFEEERRQAIDLRRQAAWRAVVAEMPEPQRAAAEQAFQESGLVGLALSGGGIRSALFNLGLLQAFSQAGFLRAVDYVCSVSGGGYISGHLAALAARHQQSAAGASTSFHDAKATAMPKGEQEHLADLGLGGHDRLTPLFRFLHVGDYLFRIWPLLGFLLSYLTATLFTLAFTAGLLGSFACLCALAWRYLDTPLARDYLSACGLIDMGLAWGVGSETPIAFLPAAAFLGLTATACLLRYLVRCAAWLGSVDLARSEVLWSSTARLLFGGFCGSLGVSLAVVLGNGEMSFDHPGMMQKLQENISGPLWLLAVASLLAIPFLRFGSVLNSAKDTAPAWQRRIFQALLSFACLGGPFYMVYWMSAENLSGLVTLRGPELVRGDFRDAASVQSLFLAFQSHASLPQAEYQSIRRAISLAVEREEAELNFNPPEQWSRHQRNRFPLQSLLAKPVEGTKWLTLSHTARVAENDALADWNAWLQDPRTTNWLLGVKDQQSKVRTEQIDAALDQLGVASAYYRPALVSPPPGGPSEDAQRAARSKTMVEQRKQLNRTLLELCFPEAIRDRRQISTPVLAVSDQQTRLRWLIFWVVLLGLGAAWDWNSGSPLFTYYKQRLVDRFLAVARIDGRRLPRGGDLLLTELDGWRCGAPFPLIQGCMQFFDEIPSRSARDTFGGEAVHVTSRQVHPFTFSPLFCGSSSLGYSRTQDYCGGGLTLGDAVAISGAAVTPFMLRSMPLRVLMAICNFRLGQWLPRPGRRSTTGWLSGAPFVSVVEIAGNYLWSLVAPQSFAERGALAFAADGGFHEFLGLEELIRRRCRLIVVADAGCNNGKYEFGVLADVLRMCRVRHGVRFLDLDHDEPLDLDQLRRAPDSNKQKMNFMCFRVRYPESADQDALIVYAQMSLTGREEVDLQQFRNINPNFPDEPITNQAYSKDQVESYRQLGCHVGRELFSSPAVHATSDREDDSKRVADELRLQSSDPAVYWSRNFRNRYLSQRWEEIVDTIPQPSALYMGDVAEMRDPLFAQLRQQAVAQLGRYFSSLAFRQEQLAALEQRLEESSGAASPAASSPVTAGEVIATILACNSRFAGGAYAPTRQVFQPGGRENLLGISIYWASLCGDSAARLQGRLLHGNSVADEGAKLARLLKDDVFALAESETIGLAVATLLCGRPGVRRYAIEEVARRIAAYSRTGDFGGLRRFLSLKQLEDDAAQQTQPSTV